MLESETWGISQKLSYSYLIIHTLAFVMLGSEKKISTRVEILAVGRNK